jgi:hypothetical protein
MKNYVLRYPRSLRAGFIQRGREYNKLSPQWAFAGELPLQWRAVVIQRHLDPSVIGWNAIAWLWSTRFWVTNAGDLDLRYKRPLGKLDGRLTKSRRVP